MNDYLRIIYKLKEIMYIYIKEGVLGLEEMIENGKFIVGENDTVKTAITVMLKLSENWKTVIDSIEREKALGTATPERLMILELNRAADYPIPTNALPFEKLLSDRRFEGQLDRLFAGLPLEGQFEGLEVGMWAVRLRWNLDCRD